MSDEKTRSVELTDDDIQFLQQAISYYANQLQQSKFQLDLLTPIPVAIRRTAKIRLQEYAERAGRLQQLLAPPEPKSSEGEIATTVFTIPLFYGYPTTTDNIELVEYIKELHEKGPPHTIERSGEFHAKFPALFDLVCAAQRDAASQRVEGCIVPKDSHLEYIEGKVRITYKGAQSDWC